MTGSNPSLPRLRLRLRLSCVCSAQPLQDLRRYVDSMIDESTVVKMNLDIWVDNLRYHFLAIS